MTSGASPEIVWKVSTPMGGYINHRVDGGSSLNVSAPDAGSANDDERVVYGVT